MIKRLSRVAPVQCGIVLGVLYAIISLIFVPFFLLFMLVIPHLAQGQNSAAPAMGASVFMVVLLPIMYGVFGFIGGIIAAAVYNLVAGWTGGLEFTLVDVATTGFAPTGYAPSIPPATPPTY